MQAIDDYFGLTDIISEGGDGLILDIWADKSVPDYNDQSQTYNHFLNKYITNDRNPHLFLSSLDNSNLNRLLYFINEGPHKYSRYVLDKGIDFFRWLYTYAPGTFNDGLRDIFITVTLESPFRYEKFWRRLSNSEKVEVLEQYENYL